jgi:hypothetical protein
MLYCTVSVKLSELEAEPLVATIVGVVVPVGVPFEPPPPPPPRE